MRRRKEESVWLVCKCVFKKLYTRCVFVCVCMWLRVWLPVAQRQGQGRQGDWETGRPGEETGCCYCSVPGFVVAAAVADVLLFLFSRWHKLSHFTTSLILILAVLCFSSLFSLNLWSASLVTRSSECSFGFSLSSLSFFLCAHFVPANFHIHLRQATTRTLHFAFYFFLFLPRVKFTLMMAMSE